MSLDDKPEVVIEAFITRDLNIRESISGVGADNWYGIDI